MQEPERRAETDAGAAHPEPIPEPVAALESGVVKGTWRI